jgi:D-serine deaminase-like pyridoxal phosphate-dependent protein
MHLSRRKLIQGSLALGALGTAAWLKPADQGKNHSIYFQALSAALTHAEIARPTLIIDKTRLLHNIHTLKTHIGEYYGYRIVVKSLPSLPLLDLIARETGSRRFMLFDERFILKLLAHRADSDILLGKPLPVMAANKVLTQTPEPSGSDIRWLVDSLERLAEYRKLAVQRNQHLRLNLEIDVGLHRGGFQSESTLMAALNMIREEPLLHFDGLMGYEPHIVKIPGTPSTHLDTVLNQYQGFLAHAKAQLGEDFPSQPILNTAGSPSYQLHTHRARQAQSSTPCNELSAGSCLVKPMDFDLPSLSDHLPACFIAAPVLKSLPDTRIPGVPGLGELMAWWNPNLKKSVFSYGGNWKAQPVSPEGLTYNPLYGRSSNQEMLNASASIHLNMNDWIFLRPTQSEAVFLQFGNIAVYEQNQLVDSWPVLA